MEALGSDGDGLSDDLDASPLDPLNREAAPEDASTPIGILATPGVGVALGARRR